MRKKIRSYLLLDNSGNSGILMKIKKVLGTITALRVRGKPFFKGVHFFLVCELKQNFDMEKIALFFFFVNFCMSSAR